ncbi:hypothetical protein L484_018308 [Morus notabilis]|uniref:Uncharacterized protein n=1 Tax=Morus notabilis TaxID=981085 RepID=W9S2R3_9ROSA|nr:hypothetical protein L484_018308 [Morus notabilis]
MVTTSAKTTLNCLAVDGRKQIGVVGVQIRTSEIKKTKIRGNDCDPYYGPSLAFNWQRDVVEEEVA